MNTHKLRNLLLIGLVAASVGGLETRPARACSTTLPLTYNGAYVDSWDTPHNLIFVYWGFQTYGDPSTFEYQATNMFQGSDFPFGFSGTRYFGVPTQYAGVDWDTFGAGASIQNPQGNLAINLSDEFGLPAPVNGVITLTDTDIQNEVDKIWNGYATSFDDIVVVFLPPNAPPPVTNACGQHFSTQQDHLAAWISYPFQAGCGGQQSSIVHEIIETAANPAWNFGPSYEGWDQGTGANCEIGDMCYLSTFTVQVQPSTDSVSQVQTQQFLSNEAIAANSNGCVYGRSINAAIFGLGADGNLYESPVVANTSVAVSAAFSWGKPSGVTLTGAPAATSWIKGRLDVFVRGTNGQMYHASSSNSGSSVTWENLASSANFTQSPDAATWGAGDLSVIGVQGTKIVKNTWENSSVVDGAWSGWKTVAGPSGITPASKVTLASWGASNINGVFPTTNRTLVAAFRGSDGNVWIGNATTGAFTWKKFAAPAKLTGDVDLAAWAPPRLDLFVLDTSGNFWDMFSNDGTTIAGSSKWAHPSQGAFQVGAGATGLGDGRLLVGGRVGTGTPYVQFYNWKGSSWVSVGGPFVSGIDIASP